MFMTKITKVILKFLTTFYMTQSTSNQSKKLSKLINFQAFSVLIGFEPRFTMLHVLPVRTINIEVSD